ncbi:MAG TPA: MFS transporter [Rhizomicrobium sp.]|nr:MFS transporter [Rhizomicrobium sp.]
MSGDDRPARFMWLPPGLRPPVPMNLRQERIFLLVGLAALFAGYDLNIFGLAIPQIQASLHIPENQVGVTVSYFRLAALVAVAVCACADLVGRRRLLLITIVGQGLFTLATAFVQTYGEFLAAQIVTRIFGYSEEMLCFVVITEEMAAGGRGWANGTLSAMSSTGTGLASLVFAAVNLLPYGWRAIYVIGALPLFLVAYLRRRLPETRRFALRSDAMHQQASQLAAGLQLARRLASEYPGRLLAILTAVAAFGFAVSPATVLMSKYLQQVQHYSPGQVTALFVPGGFAGLALSILTGRLSDRIGRKRVAFAVVALTGVCFALLYSGIDGWLLPPLWIVAFFGFFASDALLAGFALEIVPTAYRATVSGLRYLVEIGAGAISLALEGHFYDRLGTHAQAVQVSLLAIPLVLGAILFLPEPAGKTLEEMSGPA